MTKNHSEYCDPTLVERFFDGELGSDEQKQVSRHLGECALCQRALQDNQAISTLFKSHMEKEFSRVNFDALEKKVLSSVSKRRIPWWRKITSLISTKRVLIPITAMAAMIIVFSLAKQQALVLDPSAVVKSFSGECSSVMIIETPKTRQTIIWYEETS